MRVKLRERKAKGRRTSLYLAYWNGNVRYKITKGARKGKFKVGRWEYQFLKMYLVGDKTRDRQTRAKAKLICAAKNYELEKQERNTLSSKKRRANFVDFFRNLASKKRKESTAGVWNGTLKYLEEFTGSKGIKFNQLSVAWLESLKQYFIDKVSNNGGSIYFSKIRAAMYQAVLENYISVNENPGFAVKAIKLKGAVKAKLTLEEIQRLENAKCINSQIKESFIFCCYTGLRASDIRALTWNDFIERNNGKHSIRILKNKTGETIYQPLHHIAIDIIKAIKPPKNKGEKIFILPSVQWGNIVLDRWAETAGIDRKLRFHMARHFFANISLQAGAGSSTLQSLMGHKAIKTTQKYIYHDEETKQEVIERLPPLKRKTKAQMD